MQQDRGVHLKVQRAREIGKARLGQKAWSHTERFEREERFGILPTQIGSREREERERRETDDAQSRFFLAPESITSIFAREVLVFEEPVKSFLETSPRVVHYARQKVFQALSTLFNEIRLETCCI